MTIGTLRRAAAVGLGTAAIAGAALVGAQPASAGPGIICNVNTNTRVFASIGSSTYYTVAAGDAVRILYGNGSYYYGHGNGRWDGYMLADGRYYNCRTD